MDILYNHAQMMDISLHIPLKLNLSEGIFLPVEQSNEYLNKE
jgi:hypothetical protein